MDIELGKGGCTLKKSKILLSLTPVYALVLSGFVVVAGIGNRVATTMSESALRQNRHTVIIDPGHGGEDGGATSCTGVLESKFNLDIALRLNDMMHLIGMETLLIRDTDRSVYTKGETIAQKKVSDLRERVRIINKTENAIVVSIHQNTFPDGKYWGTQVFYPGTDGSRELASQMQHQVQTSLTPDNNRKSKQATGVYLMEHINCTGILLECGFLSNPEEEARLRSEKYQKELCAVIASVLGQYLSNSAI